MYLRIIPIFVRVFRSEATRASRLLYFFFYQPDKVCSVFYFYFSALCDNTDNLYKLSIALFSRLLHIVNSLYILYYLKRNSVSLKHSLISEKVLLESLTHTASSLDLFE